jgi:hypothetical protein
MARLYEGDRPRKRHVKCPLCGTKFKGQAGEQCPYWRRHLTTPNNPGWHGAADYLQFFDVRLYAQDADGQTYERVIDQDLQGAVALKTGIEASRRYHLPELDQMSRQDREAAKRRIAKRKEWRERRIYLGDATAKQMEAYKLHIEGDMSIAEVGLALGIEKRSAQARIDAAKAHEARTRRLVIISSR